MGKGDIHTSLIFNLQNQYKLKYAELLFCLAFVLEKNVQELS